MKFLRALLVLLGIGIVGAGALSIIKGVEAGSEGKVNMETMEVVAEEPAMEPVIVEMEEVVVRRRGDGRRACTSSCLGASKLQ